MYKWKVKNGKYLTTITDIFNVKNNENYNLRNNDCDFFIQKPKTNFLKKNIGYSGVKIWNELPTRLLRYIEISINIGFFQLSIYRYFYFRFFDILIYQKYRNINKYRFLNNILL